MKYIEVILLMAIVTHIPRIIPNFLLQSKKTGKRVDAFLKAIPYAALSALIIPGIMDVSGSNVMVGIVGGAVAVVLSLFGLHTILVVLGALAIALII